MWEVMRGEWQEVDEERGFPLYSKLCTGLGHLQDRHECVVTGVGDSKVENLDDQKESVSLMGSY